MEKIKVLILEGGFNEEHEVSLETGKQVKKTLKDLKINYESLVVSPITFENDIKKYDSSYICFNALHGTFGEDGKIQEVLERFSFKFTHSGSKASLIGFDKELTKNKINDTSILTPKYFVFNSQELNKNIFLDSFLNMGPFIIKPVTSGSSYGIKIFKSEKSINLFLSNFSENIKFYKESNIKLLFEQFIEGRELTVTVIEKNNLSIPIDVTEIISKNEFFDYESKYTPGFSEHVLPAKIPKTIYEKCMEDAKKIHDLINCKSISRSDFIYDDEKVYFLEINTQPGLTKLSLVPEQLNYHQISFKDFIMNLIKRA